VVAEKDTRVGPVARVSERAGAEDSVVDEVAEEDGVPLIGRIGLQRLEQTLDVAVDVPDDQDGQIVRRQPSRLPPFGAKPAAGLTLSRPFGATRGESGPVMLRSYWLGRIWLRRIGA